MQARNPFVAGRTGSGGASGGEQAGDAHAALNVVDATLHAAQSEEVVLGRTKASDVHPVGIGGPCMVLKALLVRGCSLSPSGSLALV